MYNNYRMQKAIAEKRAIQCPHLGDDTNLLSYDDIFPNREAPILHLDGDSLKLARVSWGIPSWKEGARPITNVRNLESRFWASMPEKPAHRCLVPVSSFCGWTGPKVAKWQAWSSLKDTDLCSFAGLWRNTDDGPRMAFLTCAPNDLVAPIHPKAMPVILGAQTQEQWINGEDPKSLAQPCPADRMIVYYNAETPPDSGVLLL